MALVAVPAFVCALPDDPLAVAAGKIVGSHWNAGFPVAGAGSAAQANVGDFDAAGVAAATVAAEVTARNSAIAAATTMAALCAKLGWTSAVTVGSKTTITWPTGDILILEGSPPE